MEYVLLNKDTPLLQFCIERHEDVVNLTTLVRMDISDLTIIDNATLPINMQPTIKGLKNWLLQRKIPNNRAFVENLLDAISDTENPYRYLDVTYGLSLNDTYWVKPTHSTISWSDVNLYDNPFSEIVAGIAFTGEDSHIHGIVKMVSSIYTKVQHLAMPMEGLKHSVKYMLVKLQQLWA